MTLRIHRGEFDVDRLLPLESAVDALPWDDLASAQAAFDDAPFERLEAEEIERVLSWRSSRARSAAGTSRTVRTPSRRFRAETLERRDVPTPAFAVNLLAVALPPAIADWNNRRASEFGADEAAYVAAEPYDARGECLAPSEDSRPTILPARALRGAFASFSAVAAEAYEAQPNDRALIELLAASTPNSRSLEPLSWCA